MLDAPAIELPRPPAAVCMLRDLPVRRRFPIMREMMADGRPPFMLSVLSAMREDSEVPFDGGFEFRATGELRCIDLYADAVTYTRTERGVASTPTDLYGLQLQVEGVSHVEQGGHAHRSVTDIAFAWGFNSLTTFCSAFQRQFGMSPGGLRRTMGSGKVESPLGPDRTH